MFTASYTSTETTTEAETRRMFNVLWERRQGNDTDFSITVERGEPGSWFRAHAHDLEQIFFVLEGRMEITIDDETRVIGPRENPSRRDGVSERGISIPRGPAGLDAPVRQDFPPPPHAREKAFPESGVNPWA